MSRWLRNASENALNGFDRWFCSSQGVWETVGVVTTVAVIELTYPRLDPHGFFLLWFLTLWSGVTQNMLAHTNAQGAAAAERSLAELTALAHSGAVAAARTDTMLERIASVEDQIAALLDHHGIEAP